ncbi:MAG: hypothetical protein AAF709_10915 [Pseudomonadota bacterium]
MTKEKNHYFSPRSGKVSMDQEDQIVSRALADPELVELVKRGHKDRDPVNENGEPIEFSLFLMHAGQRFDQIFYSIIDKDKYEMQDHSNAWMRLRLAIMEMETND